MNRLTITSFVAKERGIFISDWEIVENIIPIRIKRYDKNNDHT